MGCLGYQVPGISCETMGEKNKFFFCLFWMIKGGFPNNFGIITEQSQKSQQKVLFGFLLDVGVGEVRGQTMQWSFFKVFVVENSCIVN